MSASLVPSFPGEIVEDAVVITGVLAEHDDHDGEYDYFLDSVSTAEEGDLRRATVGEQTYVVAYLDDDTLVIVDAGPTDANGLVTLNAPAGEDYFIYEVDDATTRSAPARWRRASRPPGW